jgi:YfiH family protein
MLSDWIGPDWPAPARVRALSTTRLGGVSLASYARLNLGDHVGDAPAAVADNRARLRAHLPAEPLWMRQVHGRVCVDAARERPGVEADAAFSRTSGVVCAVLTADCLPVLLCDTAGTVVAAAHAGWRGLAGGVIEATVAAMAVPGERLMAWLGPAIGPQSFEVGDEVRAVFLAQAAKAASAFVPRPDGKWLCDLYMLAAQRLTALGVCRITGAEFCTVREPERFFSYRRDGASGRMASLIWLDA